MLEASERKLRESGFFCSIKPDFLCPAKSFLHKALWQESHRDPHHSLDERHLSINRTVPQRSGPCDSLCKHSLL